MFDPTSDLLQLLPHTWRETAIRSLTYSRYQIVQAEHDTASSTHLPMRSASFQAYSAFLIVLAWQICKPREVSNHAAQAIQTSSLVIRMHSAASMCETSPFECRPLRVW